MLPPDSPAGGAATAGAAAVAQPTLAQVLELFGSQGGGGSSKTAFARDAAEKVAAAGANNLKRSPADLANELQSALQQQEAEIQRAKDAAREAALGRAQPGERGQQLLHAAASRQRGLLLDSGSAGHTGSAGQQKGLSSSGVLRHVEEGTAASAVRLLVGVVSACCSETAAARRAAVRKTWGRSVQEVRGHRRERTLAVAGCLTCLRGSPALAA